MRCPKFRFPIRIIVFDELELIIFVSQGLTLSTASLVFYWNWRLCILVYFIRTGLFASVIRREEHRNTIRRCWDGMMSSYSVYFISQNIYSTPCIVCNSSGGCVWSGPVWGLHHHWHGWHINGPLDLSRHPMWDTQSAQWETSALQAEKINPPN